MRIALYDTAYSDCLKWGANMPSARVHNELLIYDVYTNLILSTYYIATDWHFFFCMIFIAARDWSIFVIKELLQTIARALTMD